MDSDDLRAIRDETGVPYMSLYGLRIQIRQLQKSQMPWRMCVDVLQSLHPSLMENLKFDLSGKISMKDQSLVWIRRRGWVRRA